MAKESKPRGGESETTPPSMPQVTPQFAQPGHDFTLQAVMEMQKTLGHFTAKIDRLADDVAGLSTKMGGLEKAVDRVKTGAVVAAFILSLVGGLLWWAIGDRVSLAVKNALETSSAPISRAPPKAD